MNKTAILALIGALLGIPLSYYFQPDIIQSKLTLSEYLSNLPDVLRDDSGNYMVPVILSVILSALVLGIVGYFMDHVGKKQIEGAKPTASKPPESAP